MTTSLCHHIQVMFREGLTKSRAGHKAKDDICKDTHLKIPGGSHLWIKRCPENNEFPNATYHTSPCSGAIIKGPQKIAYCVRCRRNTGYPAKNARTSCQISGQVFPETPPKKRWRVTTSQRISKGTKPTNIKTIQTCCSASPSV